MKRFRLHLLFLSILIPCTEGIADQDSQLKIERLITLYRTNQWAKVIQQAETILGEVGTAPYPEQYAPVLFYCGRACLDVALLNQLFYRYALEALDAYANRIAEMTTSSAVRDRCLWYSALCAVQTQQPERARDLFARLSASPSLAPDLLTRVAVWSETEPCKGASSYEATLECRYRQGLGIEAALIHAQARIAASRIDDARSRNLETILATLTADRAKPWLIPLPALGKPDWVAADASGLCFYEPGGFKILAIYYAGAAAALLEQAEKLSPEAKNAAQVLRARAELLLGNFKTVRELVNQSPEEPTASIDKAVLREVALRRGQPQGETTRSSETAMDSQTTAGIALWTQISGLVKPLSPGEKSNDLKGLAELSGDPLTTGRILLFRGQWQEAERAFIKVYDPARRDDFAVNPPDLVTGLSLTRFKRGLVAYSSALELLFRLQQDYPNARILYDVVQGLYAATIKSGGEQALDSGM